MSDDEGLVSSSAKREASRRPPLSLLVIAGLAAVAAVVHIVFPRLAIDAVTLGLLGVAALPWLTQIVKTLKFGSLEVDLRDIQQNIVEVREKVVENAQKVDDLAVQVQKITFTGETDSHTVLELTEAMNGFYAYLRQTGFPVPSSEPVVQIVDRPSADPMYYSAREGKIFVSRRLAGDATRVLQSYAQYLCASIVPLAYERWSPQLRVVERGVAVYLACSYRGTPEVARDSYEVYRRQPELSEARRRVINDREKQANLQTNRFRISRKRFLDTEAPDDAKNHPGISDALAWAGTFWKLRDLLGPEVTDQSLVEGWMQISRTPDLGAFDAIVAAIAHRAEQRSGPALAKQVQDLFRRRGLAPAGI